MFLTLMEQGGPMMWVIFGCSVISLFIFLKKVFQFHRDEIKVRDLLKGLFNVLRRDGYVEAITLCDNTPGPVARLLSAAILAYRRKDDDLRKAVDAAAIEEIPKLERGVNLFGSLGFILPLLGFTGTVLGMTATFKVMGATAENFSTAMVAGNVQQALLTTAFGLCAAIPCHLGYNYLIDRINSITLDMEKAAQEMLSFLSDKDRGTEITE